MSLEAVFSPKQNDDMLRDVSTTFLGTVVFATANVASDFFNSSASNWLQLTATEKFFFEGSCILGIFIGIGMTFALAASLFEKMPSVGEKDSSKALTATMLGISCTAIMQVVEQFFLRITPLSFSRLNGYSVAWCFNMKVAWQVCFIAF